MLSRHFGDGYLGNVNSNYRRRDFTWCDKIRCPPGWKFKKQHVASGAKVKGILLEATAPDKTVAKQCADKCDADNACVAFTHSPQDIFNNKNCFLMMGQRGEGAANFGSGEYPGNSDSNRYEDKGTRTLFVPEYDCSESELFPGFA